MELNNKLNELYIKSLELMKEGKWNEVHIISKEIEKISTEIAKRPL